MGKGGRNKLSVAEKKKRAWFLYCGGYTTREIASELGVGKTMAHRYIQGKLKEWLEENKQEIEEIRQREHVKLNHLEQRVTRKFNSSNVNDKSIEKLKDEVELKLKIVDKKIKILGLDKLLIDDNRNKDPEEISEFIKTVVSLSAFGEESPGDKKTLLQPSEIQHGTGGKTKLQDGDKKT